MTALREAGKLTPTPFDEEIEWTFYRLWHHEGRRARMGASMQGPDFVQWHGFFEVAENFYTKFLPQAKEAAQGDAKVLAAIKAVEDDPSTPGGRGSRPRSGRRSTSSTSSVTGTDPGSAHVRVRTGSRPEGVLSPAHEGGLLLAVDRRPEAAARRGRAARGPEGAAPEGPPPGISPSPLRQLVLFAGAFALGWEVETLWVRVPCALVLGFVVFDGTVLLHEVVHKAVFDGDRPGAYRLLGLVYALPSGISPTQFTRWHLDHHNELGSRTDDPKRAHLSPKRNARWLKLLYATPALFPIYFRAARAETATYPPEVQRAIRRERLAAIGLHLAAAATIWSLGGFSRFLWLYAIPVFFVFPPAFTLNRLGQHYDIVPGEPAKWSTRMARSRFWEVVYLWSNYHLEHHYFPAVPFYRLSRPERRPDALLRDGRNPRPHLPRPPLELVRPEQAPHSDWAGAGAPPEAEARPARSPA